MTEALFSFLLKHYSSYYHSIFYNSSIYSLCSSDNISFGILVYTFYEYSNMIAGHTSSTITQATKKRLFLNQILSFTINLFPKTKWMCSLLLLWYYCSHC